MALDSKLQTIITVKDLVESIPEYWYSSAVSAIEMSIASRYYVHNNFRWALPASDMTVVKFLIQANHFEKIKPNALKEKFTISQLDQHINNIIHDISADFAEKAIINTLGYSYENHIDADLIMNHVALRVAQKIEEKTDLLKGKPIFGVISRHMREIDSNKGVIKDSDINNESNRSIAAFAWEKFMDHLDNRASVYDTTFFETLSLATIPDIDEVLDELIGNKLLSIEEINLIGHYPPKVMDNDLAEILAGLSLEWVSY